MRGIAALVVVWHHLVLGFFPRWHQEASVDLVSPWARIWYQGDFAVDVFFVLSGFVLSLSFVRTGNIAVLRAGVVRRYWRLFIPIAASILLSYVLLACHLYANREAGLFMGQAETDSFWLNRWYGFRPSAGSAIHEAVWGALFSFSMQQTYNNVLWTMGAEFLGSLFVFAFLSLSGGLRNRSLIYGVAGFVLHCLGLVWLLEFLAGAAICELLHSWSAGRVPVRPAVTLASLMLGLAGLTLAGSTPEWFSANFGLPVPSGAVLKYVKPLGAVFVLLGVLGAPVVQNCLAIRPLVFLGKVSFPLYLVHVLIECSLGCHVYLACVRTWNLPHAVGFAGAALATVSVSLAVAWIGSLTVDPLSIRVGRWVYATLFEPQPPGAAERLRPSHERPRQAA